MYFFIWMCHFFPKKLKSREENKLELKLNYTCSTDFQLKKLLFSLTPKAAALTSNYRDILKYFKTTTTKGHFLSDAIAARFT